MLALLGLLLLPTNYRADGSSQHGHALLQVWADAADGRLQHHGDDDVATGIQSDWLDPLVTDQGAAQDASRRPDVGGQNDSAPASGGMPLLVDGVVVPVEAVAAAAIVAAIALLAGRPAPVPTPPPRGALAAG